MRLGPILSVGFHWVALGPVVVAWFDLCLGA
jgi:hypothetical protein